MNYLAKNAIHDLHFNMKFLNTYSYEDDYTKLGKSFATAFDGIMHQLEWNGSCYKRMATYAVKILIDHTKKAVVDTHHDWISCCDAIIRFTDSRLVEDYGQYLN